MMAALIVGLTALSREGACLVPVPSLVARVVAPAWPAACRCRGLLAASAEPEGASRKWAVVRQDEKPPVYDDARLAQTDLEAESDIQFYRAGGPGGQHQASKTAAARSALPAGALCGGVRNGGVTLGIARQNKVETAVRLTHRPTGIVVTASEHRSQWQNRLARPTLRMQGACRARVPGARQHARAHTHVCAGRPP